MDLINIKGIGLKSLEYLKKLEIFSIKDLINYYPFRYEVLKRSDLNNNEEKVIVDGIVESVPYLYRIKSNMNKMQFTMNISNKIYKIIIFNRGFLKSNIYVGKVITVIGKIDKLKNIITASNIILRPLKEEPEIIPVYKTTNSLSKQVLANYIKQGLNKIEIIDELPEYIVENNKLLSKKEALFNIHNPNNIDILKKSLLRLKYEELLMFMLKITYLKLKNENNSGINKNIDLSLINNIKNLLSFELTSDQNKVLNEIFNDLNSNKKMNRLLQGDVGSGKTIVALISCYLVCKNNFQSAFMAPTEILAKQHYENAIKIFKDIKIEILTRTTKNKKEIYNKLKNKEIDLIIGTHALIQEDIVFNNLGLIVTDEQHRFGVNQRKILNDKGITPDVLYMSATPIPRTYAHTIYADMDISVIKTLPKNKKDIITYLKDETEIKDVLSLVNEELKKGYQAYIISPLIEEDDESVVELEKKYNNAFKNYNISILHGKLNDKEKVMEDFLNKKIDILISTTVIEVGVDVKNATIIVIHDANKFGLSTLHQLRGRVGRSDIQSYCVLIGDKSNERLNIIKNNTDGFLISEEDFKLRGSGDLFGFRQSGDMNFKLADIIKDYKILLKAKEDAIELFKSNLVSDKLKKEIIRKLNID